MSFVWILYLFLRDTLQEAKFLIFTYHVIFVSYSRKYVNLCLNTSENSLFLSNTWRNSWQFHRSRYYWKSALYSKVPKNLCAMLVYSSPWLRVLRTYEHFMPTFLSNCVTMVILIHEYTIARKPWPKYVPEWARKLLLPKETK